MALALEIQHRVDDVLERLRTGEAAVLRHVSDEQRRNVPPFRGEEQLGRRLTHLADTAWRRLELEREHGLDGIDDHEGRLDAGDFLEDALQTRFSEQIQRGVTHR